MHALQSTDPHPALEGGRFLMADRTDSRLTEGQLTVTFIGLWATADGAFLGSFVRAPDGAFTPVEEELKTSFPVQSVSYFPHPHGRAGRLGLVSHAGGEVRLLAFGWGHPDL